MGFITLAAAELEIAGLPEKRRKGLPAYPIPCLRIARLAVSDDAQGKGVGAELLRHALLIAMQMVDKVGCAGVLVDAKADAVAFYAKYGFEEVTAVAGALGDRPRPTSMFLPIGRIPA